MKWSVGFRFLLVGFLALVMYIPLSMVAEIIDARASYSRSAIANVGLEWGGPQVIGAPRLVIPVRGPVVREERRKKVDPVTGEAGFEMVDVTRIVQKSPVYIFPDRFDAALSVASEERERGIFKVPVYSADLSIDFDFQFDEAALRLAPDETAIWGDAYVAMSVSSNRALRGKAVFSLDGKTLTLNPLMQSDGRRGGIAAPTGDPRNGKAYQLTLGINGAETLMITPAGRASNVTMTSDWPHPSFEGAFLPNSSDRAETGFLAEWEIPHLARNVAQISRHDLSEDAAAEAFGVRFYQPNDFYQKTYRAANYGLLFIALTFLTVLLIERAAKISLHPVQYVMIGLAQSTFVLLMVSFAEQIGFGAAYAVSGGATACLLTIFGFVGLRLGRRAWILGGMLMVLYSVLFLILRSAEYALIAGSILAFVALAGTMFATRNEDWHSGDGHIGRKWFSRKPITEETQPA